MTIHDYTGMGCMRDIHGQERFGFQAKLPAIIKVQSAEPPKTELLSLPKRRSEAIYKLLQHEEFNYATFSKKYTFNGEVPFLYEMEHFFAMRSNNPCQVKGCLRCANVEIFWESFFCKTCNNRYNAMNDSEAMLIKECFKCNTREKRLEAYKQDITRDT